MSTQARTYYTIKCDVCGNDELDWEYNPVFESPSDARDQSRDVDWVNIGDIDICDKHSYFITDWCYVCDEDLDINKWVITDSRASQTCENGHVNAIKLNQENSK